MITIDKEKVHIPRKTWDRISKDDYYRELIETLIDSEDLLDAQESDSEFVSLRDYDRKRKNAEVHRKSK